MTTEHDLEEWGGPIRARLGLHGDARTAQGIPHPFTPKNTSETICVACGLTQRASVHA